MAAYVYIREAFGPLAAFLCGWMTLLMISTGALAAVAMGFAGYVERYVDLDPRWRPHRHGGGDDPAARRDELPRASSPARRCRTR